MMTAQVLARAMAICPRTITDLEAVQVFCASDYHQATPAVAALAQSESIYKTRRFSTHAPITVDYDRGLQAFATIGFTIK